MTVVEARWAVFFDAMDHPYYYDPEAEWGLPNAQQSATGSIRLITQRSTEQGAKFGSTVTAHSMAAALTTTE
ncbi:MAG: hypothetical protein LC749_02880 [Actinobacteria bacterium]|nr:hypothetical protein [Actinomycetota bacterium]